MNLVMFGPPGSGKGTQSSRISLCIRASVIDCGRLLRGARISVGELEDLKAGNLLPDELVIKIVRERVNEIVRVGGSFVLDGFPRSIVQCKALFEMSSELEFDLSCLVKLTVSEETLYERLLGRLICKQCGSLYNASLGKCSFCGSTEYKRRDDDMTVEAIKKRVSLYSAVERDIVDLFKSKSIKVLSVDADRSVDEVAADLRTQLLMFI